MTSYKARKYGRHASDTNPLEKVLYDEADLWVEGLSELSKLDDENVQKELKKLLPGHYLGAEYRLLTEAEWEFMARNGGLAEGQYGFGNSEAQSPDHAWFKDNSSNTTHPVGQKKPIFYNGKPIYDTHGNVWELTSDWWDDKITGGLNPKGPTSGTYRVVRGGGWDRDAQYLRSADRRDVNPDHHYSNFGFRLSRTVP